MGNNNIRVYNNPLSGTRHCFVSTQIYTEPLLFSLCQWVATASAYIKQEPCNNDMFNVDTDLL